MPSLIGCVHIQKDLCRTTALQWRHNGRDSVSNHQPHDCLLSRSVHWGADQRKHQRPVNSPHKWPVTRKMFPFDDVIMVMNRSSFQHRRFTNVYQNSSGSLHWDSGESCDCPNASNATLNDMDKCNTWIQNTWRFNHLRTKIVTKTIRIFYGM